MTVVENIRRLEAEAVSARQIAIELGVRRDSVAKYTSIEDYSPKPPKPTARPGAQAPEGFTEVIDAWLAEDGHEPRVVDMLRLAHNGSENASTHNAEQVFR